MKCYAWYFHPPFSLSRYPVLTIQQALNDPASELVNHDASLFSSKRNVFQWLNKPKKPSPVKRTIDFNEVLHSSLWLHSCLSYNNLEYNSLQIVLPIVLTMHPYRNYTVSNRTRLECIEFLWRVAEFASLGFWRPGYWQKARRERCCIVLHEEESLNENLCKWGLKDSPSCECGFPNQTLENLLRHCPNVKNKPKRCGTYLLIY